MNKISANLIYWIAIFSHFIMGFAIIVGGEPAAWATSVATSLKIVGFFGGGATTLALWYLLSSALVLVSFWRCRNPLHHIDRRDALCYSVQQFFMLVSAFGAFNAIRHSRFADGVVRPWAFITADQHLWLLIGIAHTIAVVDKFTVLFDRRRRDS